MKRIIVTGGAGSIGSEVVRRYVAQGHHVTALDINEEGLWALRMATGCEVRLWDVTDQQLMPDADATIYCAAAKHVDLCEENGRQAWRVNTLGHLTVASPHAVYVSTDKAIEPTCVMGYSKRMGETYALVSGSNITRFGNVLGTRGSLVPAIKRYAALGKPIPITDPDMTRFFMPISEAVDLIDAALWGPKQTRAYVPANPRSARIGDFIDVCRELIAPGHPVVHVGPRPGERDHEKIEYGDGYIASNDKRCLMGRDEIAALLERSGCLEAAHA